MNNDIDQITQDGFSLADQDHKLKNLAIISLKIALQAYFSTYRVMKYSLDLFNPVTQLDRAYIDFNHSSAYCQNCAETIVHFQHFIELVCKDFLRNEHELLAIDASKDPVIFHKLLCKEEIPEQEYEGIKTLEFREALCRLCTLIKERSLGAGRLEFIVDARKFLEKLNTLRNREWHRGAFILRYPALDELVGKYILPFISEIVALPEYADLTDFWKYKKLSCNIDPISEIINTVKSGTLNIGKIAVLKELGRAAYENPLFNDKTFLKYINDEYSRRANHIAEKELHNGEVSCVKTCPVCGINSLVVYHNVEGDESDADSGTYCNVWLRTHRVECMCCTFEINRHLENPSKYGLSIEDYWKSEDL